MQPEHNYDAAFYDEDGWGRPAAPAATRRARRTGGHGGRRTASACPDDAGRRLSRTPAVVCERDHTTDPPLASIFCNNCGRYLCAACHSLVHEGPTPPCLGLSCCTPLTPPPVQVSADAAPVPATEAAVGEVRLDGRAGMRGCGHELGRDRRAADPCGYQHTGCRRRGASNVCAYSAPSVSRLL
jgi:hypothetical protein